MCVCCCCVYIPLAAVFRLDSESERVVQAAIDDLLSHKNLAGTTTAFIVAHRLSTIKNADRIVFLQDGVAAEIGSHEELMAKEEGLYRAMVYAQSGTMTNMPTKTAAAKEMKE